MSYATALVTGASSGLGRGLALALARRGTRVVVAARRRANLDELVGEIAREGGSAEALEIDAADPDATHAAVRALDERLALDLVIANAGIGGDTSAKRIDWDRTRDILNVNVLGAAATLVGALPGMVARDRGHLVGVTSIAGFRGMPRSAAYSASKAALSTFLEGLRVDLHGSGVSVTDLRPGFVKTEMTAKMKAPMPFLLECDEAVARMLAAIDRRASDYAFPAPTAIAGRASRFIPNAIFDRLAGKARK